MSKKRATAKSSRRRSGSARAGKTRGPAAPARATTKAASARTLGAVAAIAPSTAGERQLASLMKVLTDRSAPIDARLSALQRLGAARFSSPAFPSSQGDYIAALRKVADDPDHELRQRVLGILAREKDGYAQKRLLEGLRDPEKALVPPEKALQLLSYDPHADAYPIAREIADNPPNPTAKREALRLLAADAASAPMFETLLRDKHEPVEIRQLSASALLALKPDSLQAHARDIVLDAAEPEAMHQTSLTALTQFGGPAIATDKALVDRVEQLSTRGSAEIQNSAQKLRAKLRR
jgi:hypothetical protein